MTSLTSFSVSSGTSPSSSQNQQANETQNHQQQQEQPTHQDFFAGSSPSFLSQTSSSPQLSNPYPHQHQQQQDSHGNTNNSNNKQQPIIIAKDESTLSVDHDFVFGLHTTTPPRPSSGSNNGLVHMSSSTNTTNMTVMSENSMYGNKALAGGGLGGGFGSNMSTSSQYPFVNLGGGGAGGVTFIQTADDSSRSDPGNTFNQSTNSSNNNQVVNTLLGIAQGGSPQQQQAHHNSSTATTGTDFFASNGISHEGSGSQGLSAGVNPVSSGVSNNNLHSLGHNPTGSNNNSSSHLSKIPSPILANIPSADDGTPNVVNGYTVPKLYGNQVFQPLTNLYVSNLSMAVDNDLLFSWFRAFGPLISACVMVDVHTGRSRGYGFVQYEKESDGEAALKGLNGKVMHVPRDNTSIIVKVQRSMHHKGIPAAPSSTIFLRNIPNTYDSAQLLPIMSQYGEVERIQLFSIFENPRLLKACVDFKTQEGALAAVNALHRKLLDPTCEVALAARFADQNRKMHHQQNSNNNNNGSGANSPSDMLSSSAASRRESLGITNMASRRESNVGFENPFSTTAPNPQQLGNSMPLFAGSGTNSPGPANVQQHNGGVRRESSGGLMMGHPNGLPPFHQQQQQQHTPTQQGMISTTPPPPAFGSHQQMVWIGGQQVQLVPLNVNPAGQTNSPSGFQQQQSQSQQQQQQPQFMMVQLQPGQPPVMVAIQPPQQQLHQLAPPPAPPLQQQQQQQQQVPQFTIPAPQSQQNRNNFLQQQQHQQQQQNRW